MSEKYLVSVESGVKVASGIGGVYIQNLAQGRTSLLNFAIKFGTVFAFCSCKGDTGRWAGRAIVGGHRWTKNLDFSNQHSPAAGHNQKQSSETKKLKIGPTSSAPGLISLPGGLEHPQVPGELLFGTKLKIYVETLCCEHF